MSSYIILTIYVYYMHDQYVSILSSIMIVHISNEITTL